MAAAKLRAILVAHQFHYAPSVIVLSEQNRSSRQNFYAARVGQAEYLEVGAGNQLVWDSGDGDGGG